MESNTFDLVISLWLVYCVIIIIFFTYVLFNTLMLFYLPKIGL